MTTEGNQIEVSTQTGESNPLQIIKTAILDENVDPAKLEKLMELQERWESNNAKKAFHEAIVAFQTEMPAVHKARSGPKGNYQYASYDDVIRAARPVLKKHGLGVRFEQTEDNERVTIICHVIHRDGHSESTTFTGPKEEQVTNREGRAVTSRAQAQGSTNSYYKRYCLCNALDIVVSDEDDDGALGGEETITADQILELNTLITDTGTELGKFLQWAKVEAVEDLPASKFKKAKSLLRQKGSE